MKKIILLLISLCWLLTGYAQIKVDTAIVPQYAVGLGKYSKINVNRLPFYTWVQLSGLKADSTYIYSCLMDTGINNKTTGAGSTVWIDFKNDTFYTSNQSFFSQPYQSGKFKADASGKYSGWFSVVPDYDYRFKAGNTVFFKIVTNNGTSLKSDTSATQAISLKQPIKMLNFFDSSKTNDCSFFYDSTYLKPKNFVFLYDNIYGNNRPLSAAVVEKTGINYTNPITGVQYFTHSYKRIENRSSLWGTILPDTLVTGVRRLEYRYFGSGIIDTLFQTPKDTQGVWPSGVKTINPTNDTFGIKICSLCPTTIDMAINSIDHPTTTFNCNKDSTTVSILLLNNSTIPFKGFYVYYQVNKDPVTVENVGSLVIQGKYNPSTNYAHFKFATPASLKTGGGLQTIKIWVSVPADINRANDTAVYLFYNLRKPLKDSIFSTRDSIKIHTVDSFYTNNQALKYKWNFGDTSKVNDTFANTTHVFNQLGKYTVTLIGNGGVCGKDTVTKTIVVVNHYLSVVSLKAAGQVKIYPNPATQNFTMSGFTAIPSSVNVYNLLGQHVYSNYEYSGGNLIVYTDQLLPGEYFILITAAGSIMTHRFTKQ